LPKKKTVKKAKTSKKKKKKVDTAIEIIDLGEYKKTNPEKNFLSQAELELLVSKEQKTDLIIERELSDLDDSYSLLVLASPQSYAEIRLGIIRRFAKQKGIYVTLNSTYSALIKEFNLHRIKIEETSFIDMISSMTNIGEVAKKGVAYLESATDLTELVLLIDKNLSKFVVGSFLIVDSVSTLLVYNEPKEVEKLVHVLVGKANSFNSRLVLLMVDSKEHEGIIETIGQFCTRVVKIDKIKI